MTQLQEEVIKFEAVAVRRGTAAAMLDCSPSTVEKLLRQGKLKTCLVGSDKRITVDSIRALVQAATCEQSTPAAQAQR